MFAYRTRTALAAVAVCAFSLVARAEMIDNPTYKAWAAQKVGTSVKMRMLSEAAGNKTKMETTTTLTELTPDKAVVEAKTTMEVSGQKMDLPAQKQEIPAKIDNAGKGTTGPKPDVKESEETVDVGGKSYKCKVTESTSEAGGNKTTAKVWMCPEVPGGMVKMVSNTDGQIKSTTTMELVEVAAK